MSTRSSSTGSPTQTKPKLGSPGSPYSPTRPKVITSKVGSLDNIHHKPGGGTTKVASQALPRYANVQSKVGSLDNVKHKPGGGEKKVFSEKLAFQETAQAKVPPRSPSRTSSGKSSSTETSPTSPSTKASRRVSAHIIPTQKLDFSHVKSKVGSLDNAKHKPAGGTKKIFDEKPAFRSTAAPRTDTKGPESHKRNSMTSPHVLPDQKLDFSKVKSKIGSKDNIHHKPGGGQNKIFSEKLPWSESGRSTPRSPRNSVADGRQIANAEDLQAMVEILALASPRQPNTESSVNTDSNAAPLAVNHEAA
ncbi:hypothetical protein BZG36_04044 [Bifiguratus adelaidae]|uniref:Microtubule-associated protein n=1 Tax=Bifiguratus adelaidae TaxID=1938954 RepID=A0A261Y059_9FUNG|nr:hypothetical protein BZG36_04044 [Bifiguratus adelaidae]